MVHQLEDRDHKIRVKKNTKWNILGLQNTQIKYNVTDK